MTTPDAPVIDTQRIRSLDVLRGVAVLGILVMNITSFGLVSAAYMNPTVYGELAGADYWAWLLGHVFADMKMMGIFSMLFGAGIVLMADRLDAAGGRPAAIHYRRMAWLLLFGLIHAYGIWFGDILYTYALCGMVAYPLRRLPPWLLLVLGVIALAACELISIGWAISLPHWPESQLESFEANSWAPPPDKMAEEHAIYRDGWLAQMKHRVPTAFFFEMFMFVTIFAWRAGGMILLGMALFKWGVFSARRSNGFYAALVAIAAIIGIPVILYGVRLNTEAGWPVETMFTGFHFNYWASILVSLGWVGVACLWVRLRGMDLVSRVLSATGQMAFTNYLMQSILCTLFFYGHGLGYFGRLGRAELLLVVLAVWAAQLTWSPLWLSRFRYGPFEWIWRSLTYWKLQPMRRSPGS